MHVSLCAIALALMYASAAVAQPVAPRSGTYNLDPRHASVTFSVGHMGLSRTVGRFNTIDATLTLDAAAPERSRLIATIEAVSVDTGSSFVRRLPQGVALLERRKQSANPL
jgi:polyisoprenoid-binding protein YceI